MINDPYKDINWIEKRAIIYNKDNEPIFDEIVTFPDYFNDNSINIVASKYFQKTSEFKETDLRHLINRVSNTITKWGEEQNYFQNDEGTIYEDKNEFEYKLKYYQIKQYFAFNSPVYFNVGISDNAQTSACFILDVEDSIDSISNIIVTESRIFKKGSGSGMNISPLRSKFENISNLTGYASGPVSFMKVHDVSAGIIKSGGALRRSAKLVCMNIDHPDIFEFVECKKFEEEKLRLLRENKISARKGYELADEVFFQNTNISVTVTDDFMNRVLEDKTFDTKFVTNGKVHKTYKARDMLYKIAELAWECGDPGLQFHDTINEYNTCLEDGKIVSSNPCGEYMFLNNSACNLASINLMKFFRKEEGKIVFDYDTFADVINTVITAQDIIIEKSSFPSDKIKENSHNYRPLGLGFSNLGSLLMFLGFPYDSDEGRLVTSHISALMTGCAYLKSSDLALKKGPFKNFERNKNSFYNVLRKHKDNLKKLKYLKHPLFDDLREQTDYTWNNIEKNINDEAPFRNAQTTLLAPTGTISFLMGCQTTGIEPEFSHVKYKRLSNSESSTISIVSDEVKNSLKNLKYSNDDINEIEKWIVDGKNINECECILDDHKKIFYTSNSCYNNCVIPYQGHIKMLSAAQPFISGAISKTVNFTNNATVEDIFKCYIESWKLGLKGVAIYRDGSKSFQPLSTKKDNDDDEFDADDIADMIEDGKLDLRMIQQLHSMLAERKLPNERPALNHKFSISGLKGYLNCGLYEDGSLGEIFITISKEGSTLSGLLDCLATMTSISLQRGVPLKDIVEKMSYQKFEPSGFTENKDIRIATSIVDYIFRYLGIRFLSKNDQLELGLIKAEEDIDDSGFEKNEKVSNHVVRSFKNNFAGPTCNKCGSLMIKKGSCNMCMNCGNNEGSCG